MQKNNPEMTDKVIRRTIDLHLATALHDKPLAGRVLAGRGLQDAKEVYLKNNLLPHPKTLADFTLAVSLLADAVTDNKKIIIVGDYDADGATSTALATHVLRSLGADVEYLVPNRFEYGYGLSAEIVAVALQRKPDLLLTVDNGIASNEGVEAAVAAGVTVVVTDHHLPPEVLPIADAMVNPNRKDCEFPSKNICGVGVIFYVMTGLCRQLEKANWFSNKKIKAPHMPDYFDLVALGTVADVVPLDQTNRILVDQGVRRIRADKTRPGIKALFSVAGRAQNRCQTQDLGFFIAPRLNASGRLTDMSVGIECLLAEDDKSAMALASELDKINRQRRSIQAGMSEEAEAQVTTIVEQLNGELPAAITLFEPHWHEGVIGIVAGRIKERFNRPVFAFAPATGGMLKGSGRSINDVHIRDILMEVVASRPGLLKKFGGHAMAAGVSLAKTDLEVFTKVFAERVHLKLDGRAPTREWLTDGELDDDEMCLENAELMQFLQPWGQAFPAPVFDDVFHIESVKLVGNNHSKMMLRRANGKRSVPAIAFNRQIQSGKEQTWRAVYRLDVNHYRNSTSLQLLVEYLEPA